MINIMRSIGMHLRIEKSLPSVLDRAIKNTIPAIQFFVRLPKSPELIVTLTDAKKLSVHYRDAFNHLFVHASYWINLARERNNGYCFFEQEMMLADALGADGLILHPGSAKGALSKIVGIDNLARSLNRGMKRVPNGMVILENTAHGNFSIGSDIVDFGILFEKLAYPERVRVAIDTAHAFVYGYNIVNPDVREQLIQLIIDTVGVERLSVIHLNDASKICGSQDDVHALIGAGTIGIDPLKSFVLDSRLRHIPIILEPPLINEQEEMMVLTMINNWHKDFLR